MTASQLPPGTTSSPDSPFRARVLALLAVLLACLATAVPAAHAATGRTAAAAAVGPTAERSSAAAASQAVPRRFARPAVRGGCAPAHGLLRTRRSVLRTQRRLLCLMNRARARFGLPVFHANRCLHRVAARHAHDMVHRRYFAHVTPNGWDPGRRARISGYVPRSAAWLVGENIAWGVAGAARPAWVMRAWMHSAGHRRNLLSPRFRDVGIGVARGVPVAAFPGLRLRATFSVEFGAHGGRTRCDRATRQRAKHRHRHRRRAKRHARRRRR
jgi:uncharacterized protein YkwD